MSYSILVVEDEDDIREMVSTALRERGFSVLSVPNAEVALTILLEHVKFDLLFTDIVMPGVMNGFELAEEAKRLQPGLKILYATGFMHLPRQSGGGTARHGRLIHKPYRPDELIFEVDRALHESGG